VNLNEYQELAKRTHTTNLTAKETFANYALGLNGEAGEVADMLKKGMFHGHEMNRHEIAKELGDVLWYVSLLAHLLDFSLDEIATMNVQKLMARYPNGFDKERSVNRDKR
jgi:NTP pyrophosphatase (non-canonical NTP hydrolase)